MYKSLLLIILLGMALFSTAGYAEAKEKGKSWKGSVTEADLVTVVNFLINNKGKKFELDGKKHIITGKERLDVVINVLSCCDKESFAKYISVFGEVKDVKFPSFQASVPADAVPEIDENGEVTEIKFEPAEHVFWMNAIQQ